MGVDGLRRAAATEDPCAFPYKRYFPVMTENSPVRLDVQRFLARKQLTVADLMRRLQKDGSHFDKKTIYRLASDEPVRHLNLRAVAAIGHALELSDPGKLIVWPTTSRLQRIDTATQGRLDELMDKNTEGTLNAAERRELDRLGQRVEKLSLENARLLASHGAAAKKPPGRQTSPAPQTTRRRTGSPKASQARAAVR